MKTVRYKINWPLIFLVAAVVGILFTVGLHRIKIDTDIVGSLPQSDPVVSDARHVFIHHPIQDKIVIDLSHQGVDMDILLEGAEFIEKGLRESGYFKTVGISQAQMLFPELITFIANNLSIMFTEKELVEKISPDLKSEIIRETLTTNFNRLLDLEGIGQSQFLTLDPLGLKNYALAKLAHMAPSTDTQIYKGQLISKDGRHLLIIAEPKTAGTDTTFARQATELINNIGSMLNQEYSSRGYTFTLTPVGAFRASMDNERIAKEDTEGAIVYVTLGIMLLLIFAFPRPFIGLLSLIPAVVGTMMAIFVYSFIYESISVLAIGFGGAIISITVDHGIAYLLFLDRPHETHGKDAAKEVWSVGLLATMTTVGAFLILSISGFPILAQIGQFAALGIAFSFIFVHSIFPMIFPSMPPAKRERFLLLSNLIKKLSRGGKYTFVAALVFSAVMLYFAKIEFHVNLESLNTLSDETLAAEKLIRDTWGNIFSKIYIMIEGKDIAEIQKKSDRLVSMLDNDVESGMLDSAFNPSMIFPGEVRAKQNLSDWRNFWNPARAARVKRDIKSVSRELGFAPDAFDPFFDQVAKRDYAHIDIPERFFSFMGISESRDGSSMVQFSTLTIGSDYNPLKFYNNYAQGGFVKIFDPQFFSKRLGELLTYTFVRMAVIIGISVMILLLCFFLDWRLTFAALMPIAFALICTLGTMDIIGQPLDIPALMLAIVVFGMGVDYSLFFVRSYQRYMDDSHPSLGLIRIAVFLASASTMIGFGILAASRHSMLKSVGIISLLGIGYSLIGAFAILPPLLRYIFTPKQFPSEELEPGSKKHLSRVRKRYLHMEAYPRLLARYKIMFDPMFPRLADFFNSPKKIIDVGSGYGVPAAWLLELYPNARVYGIEPDPERVRIASRVIGGRGSVECRGAPDLPALPDSADAALLLDIIHLLTDDGLRQTLEKIKNALNPAGSLIVRANVPSEKRFPWERWLEHAKLKAQKANPNFRGVEDIKRFVSGAGFEITTVESTAPNREETWIIAKAIKD